MKDQHQNSPFITNVVYPDLGPILTTELTIKFFKKNCSMLNSHIKK